MSLAYDHTAESVMSAAEFTEFYERRPEGEHWELIAGVPIMMTPPTLVHNIISGNLARLLTDATKSIKRRVVAVQRSGIVITDDDYRPEPDVIVTDAVFDQNSRYSDRIYLVAETISRTDQIPVPGRPAKWIDVKREIYRAHEPCEAIIFIQQNRFDVVLDIRTETGWSTQNLTDPHALLDLPSFGLRCELRELYAQTPLNMDAFD